MLKLQSWSLIPSPSLDSVSLFVGSGTFFLCGRKYGRSQLLAFMGLTAYSHRGRETYSFLGPIDLILKKTKTKPRPGLAYILIVK